MKTATVKDLIAVARTQIGTKECPAGSNRVKYNTAYYGREVSGKAYPWCAVFIWWCCVQAGVDLPVRTASCTALMNAAKKAGMWVTSDYRPGDIAIYDWGGDKVPDHCGIITQALSNGYLCSMVTNCRRVSALSSIKSPLVLPCMMPLSTAHCTASGSTTA